MRSHVNLLRLGALALVAGACYVAFSTPDAAPAQAARPDPNYFGFVHSMDGTKPDGDIKQNWDEQLVVDAELGHLFDYYLAGLGEQSLDAIRSQIEHELDQRLKPAPAAQAKRLLASYLQYKRALVDLEREQQPAADLAASARKRLYAMQQLRSLYFSPQEIAGLFGESDAYDADAIARLDINSDRTLTPAQRQQKLAALDAKLSPQQRAQREAPTKILRLEDAVQQARAQGAGDNEVYQMRAAALSPEAAARLADFDRGQAEWQQRIADYQAQRKQLLSGPAAPSDATLQQLRDARFTPDEQKRLGAYE